MIEVNGKKIYYSIKYVPKKYQIEALDFIKKSILTGNKYILLNLPTGTGKSFIISTMFTNWYKNYVNDEARFDILTNSKILQDQYIKDFDGNSFTAIGPSNTPSRSIYNDVYYLHLLESTGINTFKDGGIASDVTLFKQGQTFTPSSTFFKYGNKFNSQKTIGYTISIGQMTNQEVVINITKTA